MKTDPGTAANYSITDGLQKSLQQRYETQARINARLYSLAYRLLGIELSRVDDLPADCPEAEGAVPRINRRVIEFARLQEETEAAITALENL